MPYVRDFGRGLQQQGIHPQHAYMDDFGFTEEELENRGTQKPVV